MPVSSTTSLALKKPLDSCKVEDQKSEGRSRACCKALRSSASSVSINLQTLVSVCYVTFYQCHPHASKLPEVVRTMSHRSGMLHRCDANAESDQGSVYDTH